MRQGPAVESPGVGPTNQALPKKRVLLIRSRCLKARPPRSSSRSPSRSRSRGFMSKVLSRCCRRRRRGDRADGRERQRRELHARATPAAAAVASLTSSSIRRAAAAQQQRQARDTAAEREAIAEAVAAVAVVTMSMDVSDSGESADAAVRASSHEQHRRTATELFGGHGQPRAFSNRLPRRNDARARWSSTKRTKIGSRHTCSAHVVVEPRVAHRIVVAPPPDGTPPPHPALWRFSIENAICQAPSGAVPDGKHAFAVLCAPRSRLGTAFGWGRRRHQGMRHAHPMMQLGTLVQQLC